MNQSLYQKKFLIFLQKMFLFGICGSLSKNGVKYFFFMPPPFDALVAVCIILYLDCLVWAMPHAFLSVLIHPWDLLVCLL